MPPTDFMFRLNQIDDRLNALAQSDDSDDSDDEREDHVSRGAMTAILEDACKVANDAEQANDSQLSKIVAEVDGLLNKALGQAYSSDETFDFAPSFAHLEPSKLVKEQTDGESITNYQAHETILSLRALLKLWHPLKDESQNDSPFKLPEPWNTTSQPHPKTTPLARFRVGDAGSSLASDKSAAKNIFQARCEVVNDQTSSPINLSLSSDGSVLALTSAGGWKNRSPILECWNTNGDATELSNTVSSEIGFEGVAWQSYLDQSSGLIFMADDSRIKSFTFAPNPARGLAKAGLPVHTMCSDGFQGPLFIMSGNVIKAGKGSIALWSVDELHTHGPDGTQLIGEELEVDSWRDEDDDIEKSTGNVHGQTLSLRDKTLEPQRWHPHPSRPGSMICASDPHKTNSYSCVSLNVETGRTDDRFLGHGGEILQISTSDFDPNAFVTACSDGFARLYDTRSRLPALTLDVGMSGSFCPAAVLCHPDGIPAVFTGSDKAEVIKLWDIRAKASLYELATGNNAVVSMAWDPKKNSLYAATECHYVDRLGYHHDYRPAKLPKFPTNEPGADAQTDTDDEESDGDNSDFESEDDDIAWPKRAFHAENYFGYAFDAGEHRIYHYKFKGDPDTSVVPEYGSASVHSGEGYY